MEGRQVGPYRIRSELGSGGMGRVYLAEIVEPEPGDTVAVKLLHPHLVSDSNVFERFLREAEVGRQIRHENVVRTLDAGVAKVNGDTIHYLAMEFVRGRTLRRLLLDLWRVPEGLVREIARQSVAGLQAIHAAGIVHRDLKPENILITEDDQVRIMDLGLALLVEQSVRLTKSGQFTGSVHYAAPEQLRGEAVLPASDLYSLGVALYELITGENPFVRDTVAATLQAHLTHVPAAPHDRSPETSPFLSELITRLLAKDPKDRFASSKELAEVLEAGESSVWWAEREAESLRRRAELPQIRVRRETAIHGRKEELAEIRKSWEQARDGHGSVLLVEGEDGIGKSRLVDEFVRGLSGETAYVLYGSYPPVGGPGGLSEAILGRFGAAGLADGVRPYLEATPDLVTPFVDSVRDRSPEPGGKPLASGALHAVMVHLMRALSEERPVVWIVEDLHFAEPDSHAIVLAMARALAGHRVFLLLTARPGLPESFVNHLTRDSEVSRLTLSRLGARRVIELLGDAFGSTALAERLGGKIALKSDGVPLFVFEMLRGLRESGFLQEGKDGIWIETQIIGEIEVPSRVRDLIEARLGEIPDEDRSLLDVAAVLGFTFDPDLVARLKEMKRVRILERLAAIERRTGIVRAAGRSYRFDHHQIQEVLYARLSGPLRDEYHALAAEAIADREGIHGETPGDVPGETAWLLATHHLRGCRPEAGLPFILPALDHLSESFRNEAARKLADHALLVPGLLDERTVVEVLIRKARSLEYLGPVEMEHAVLMEACRRADAMEEASLRALLRERLGWFLDRTADLDGALEAFRESEALAHEAGNRAAEFAAIRGEGGTLRKLGRHADSRQKNLDALEIAREIGSREGEGMCMTGLGNVEWHLGRKEEAARWYEQALEVAQELGKRQAEAVALGNLGLVSIDLGGHEAAREYLVAAIELHESLGDRRGEGVATGNLALLEMNLGNYAEAERLFERDLGINLDLGNRYSEGIARLNLAELRRFLGDRESSIELLGRAMERFREIDAPGPLGYAHTLEGRLHLDEDRTGSAGESFTRAVELLRGLAEQALLAMALRHQGAMYVGLGREADAARALDEAIELAREVAGPDNLVAATAWRAHLPDGDPAAARRLLDEHRGKLSIDVAMESQMALWRLTGERELLEEAYRLLMHLVENAPESRRGDVPRAVPINREILEGWQRSRDTTADTLP